MMEGEVQIWISGATAQALKNMSREKALTSLSSVRGNECDDDVIHRLIGWEIAIRANLTHMVGILKTDMIHANTMIKIEYAQELLEILGD